MTDRERLAEARDLMKEFQEFMRVAEDANGQVDPSLEQRIESFLAHTQPSHVSDITPSHKPIMLARETVEKIEQLGEKVEGIVVCLALSDNTLTYELAGAQNTDMLWAMERLKHRMMMEANDDRP